MLIVIHSVNIYIIRCILICLLFPSMLTLLCRYGILLTPPLPLLLLLPLSLPHPFTLPLSPPLPLLLLVLVFVLALLLLRQCFSGSTTAAGDRRMVLCEGSAVL